MPVKTDSIRVGLSTRHGMADEMAANPPKGIVYTFPTPTRKNHRFIRSPIKSYLWEFKDTSEFDILEAVLSPVLTDAPWICSLDTFPAAVAYGLRGIPVPRWLRVGYISKLFKQANCLKIVFWSEAARRTLIDYGRVTDHAVLDKSTVVYPAIRAVSEDLIRYSEDQVNLLFSGDFFRKGGANVVDVFEILQKEFAGIRLRICCDEKLDFNTPNQELRAEYLDRIRSNPFITFGRASRDVMLNEILPQSDIYLLPTYSEAFGFAILEAMAYGIPVVATNVFAIPEILTHEGTGVLIDIKDFDTEKLFPGYLVSSIPNDFSEVINEQMLRSLRKLISSSGERQRLGTNGRREAMSKFGFQNRNNQMNAIYENAC